MPNNKKQSNDDSVWSDVGDAISGMMPNSDDNNNNQDSGKGNQGFASMSKARQREIASKGGKAAHQAGTAHEWDSAEAARAGKKGGQNKAA